MQNLLLTEEMKCGTHLKPRDNLNLSGFIQDERQLICDNCNYSGTNSLKLLDLEKFLLEFNNQIQMFTQELANTKMLIIVAKKITEQITKMENEVIEIDKKLQIKQKMNQTIQQYLNYNLNKNGLKELLQYLKNNQINENQVKSNKSMLENEIQQQKKCNQAINILQMAQDEINNILAYPKVSSEQLEQTLKQVYSFDKQVEQDFDERIQVYDMQLNNTGLLLAVGSSRVECDDCYAQIWEVDGGVLRKSYPLKGHQREVKSLFFHEDDTVFTGSVDSTIKIWVKQQYENIWDLKQDLNTFHSLAVNCIKLHYSDPKFFASGSEELIIWKKDLLQNGLWVKDSEFKNNTRIIQALSFSNKGNLLIVGSDDRLIQILEFAHSQWKLKHKFAQDNKIMQIISTYNRDFISFQIDGEYTVWKCKSDTNGLSWDQAKFKHEGQIKKLSFSLAKKLLGVTYEDKKIKLFQIEIDGKFSEKQLDNNEGDIMIMSYLSPIKLVQKNVLITQLGKPVQGNQDGIVQNNIKLQSPQPIIMGKQGQQQVYINFNQNQQNFNQNQQNVKFTGLGNTPVTFNPLKISEMPIEQSKFVKISKGKLQVYMERSKPN